MDTEEFVALDNRSRVAVETYNKPVRFYSDVDGILVLYFDTLAEQTAHPNHARINLFKPDHGNINVVPLDIEWNIATAKALSSYSHNSQIDFLWLTSWNVNAPAALDPLFKIKSKGYLPWNYSPTDYNQFFKAVALLEDQRAAPSALIWVDDVAANVNSIAFLEREGLDLSHALIIKTNMTVGLTISDMKRIDSFLLEQKLT